MDTLYLTENLVASFSMCSLSLQVFFSRLTALKIKYMEITFCKSNKNMCQETLNKNKMQSKRKHEKINGHQLTSTSNTRIDAAEYKWKECFKFRNTLHRDLSRVPVPLGSDFLFMHISN
jgi:hypothetical protein